MKLGTIITAGVIAAATLLNSHAFASDSRLKNTEYAELAGYIAGASQVAGCKMTELDQIVIAAMVISEQEAGQGSSLTHGLTVFSADHINHSRFVVCARFSLFWHKYVFPEER